MTSSPVPECPEIDALVITDIAVHLILRIERDWAADRQAAVAEVERKTQAATSFATSPVFKARYGARIGVLRVQSPSAAPSIVAHLLSEQGVELEHVLLDDAAPRDGEPSPPCSFCKRDRLPSEQVSMTDSGWACPSCFRAWSLKTQPQLAEKPSRLRIPPKLILPLIILIAVLFALGAYYELHRLNGMNSIIRQHMPHE